jgi:tripartite-type tricarboxylate transporter receptor subunit TctC
MGTPSILVTNQLLYRKINYNPQTDFAPISYLGTQANILVVHPSVQAKSVSELIALARANPGKLNFASGGFGAGAHLSGELFKVAAKVNIVHVPYKGTGPAFQDVVAGHIQMMFPGASSVVGALKDGKVRALAVTTLKRTAILPDIPTFDELGLKGFESSTWHGLVAPAGTPKAAIDTLHRATVEALKDAEVRSTLGRLGVDIVVSSPAELADYIKSETPKWAAIVKATGGKLK